MGQVLVVEGDVAVSETMRSILEDAGYMVVEVPDYGEAVRLLHKARSCQVVLFDRGVPGRSKAVAAFLAAIASDEPLRQRHVYVCLSAVPPTICPEDQALFERLGIPILAMPFDIEALEEVVARSARLCQLMPPSDTPETVAEST